MKEQEFRNRVDYRGMHHREQGRKWVGLFLLLAGGLLLARAGGAALPYWIFTWPMLLIGFGILSGIRHQFRGFGWLIPILIGGFFLLDKLSPELHLKPYIWPVALIIVGLAFLFRPKRHRHGPHDTIDGQDKVITPATGESGNGWQGAVNDRSDFFDATAILGGIKKNVMSKNFRGGDITTFMGGAEINLTQADCQGRVVIDCFNMFGGTKLIIPADWNVQSDVMTIFGGIEDKRHPAQAVDPNKVLILDGTCLFGGVEIKSF